MTFAEKLLALALLAQMILTLAVLIQLGWRRADALKAGETRGNLMLDSSGWPDDVRKVHNNFVNQFETPVLFYALGLLAFQLKAATLLVAVLAWVFVVSRLVHWRVHTGPNTLPLRGGSFMVGAVALLVMIVILALDILSNGFLR